MSDIVERLRRVKRLLVVTDEMGYDPDDTLASEAADEIERLRGALVRICNWYPISVAKPRETITEIQQFAFAQLKKKREL
ncbi:MAG: hypothetical protein RIQ99_475 [Pseudomonadota bacterium]|jgi:hypothetical protein